MKKLKKWLEANNYTQIKLAKKLGVTTSGLSRYINGSRKIPLNIAVNIEKITKGEVTCKDLA